MTSSLTLTLPSGPARPTALRTLSDPVSYFWRNSRCVSGAPKLSGAAGMAAGGVAEGVLPSGALGVLRGSGVRSSGFGPGVSGERVGRVRLAMVLGRQPG